MGDIEMGAVEGCCVGRCVVLLKGGVLGETIEEKGKKKSANLVMNGLVKIIRFRLRA